MLAGVVVTAPPPAEWEALHMAGACSPDLEYNLGTAYLEHGDLGRAVQHLTRAQLLSTGRPGSGLHPGGPAGPTGSDIIHNLELARARVRGGAVSGAQEQTPAWDRSLRELAAGTLALLFIICWVLLFASLILRQLARTARARRRAGIAAVVLACVLAGALLVGVPTLYARHGVRRGVLLEVETQGTEAPHPQANRVFRAPAGTEVRILDRRAGFRRVRLDSGLDGWVREDVLGEI